VYFVGHGLAAAKVLVLLSVRPDFNQKIRLASLMAPTVFGNNMRSPLRFLGPFTFLESVSDPSYQWKSKLIVWLD